MEHYENLHDVHQASIASFGGSTASLDFNDSLEGSEVEMMLSPGTLVVSAKVGGAGRAVDFPACVWRRRFSVFRFSVDSLFCVPFFPQFGVSHHGRCAEAAEPMAVEAVLEEPAPARDWVDVDAGDFGDALKCAEYVNDIHAHLKQSEVRSLTTGLWWGVVWLVSRRALPPARLYFSYWSEPPPQLPNANHPVLSCSSP